MANKKQLISFNYFAFDLKIGQMRDIEDKEDILLLVTGFYNQALSDNTIGPIFRKANFVIESHIPVMVSFWETILFDVITYRGNPMLKHLELHRTVTLKPGHFEQWLNIWQGIVSSNFTGPLANKAVVRARSIAHLIMHKTKQLG